jgi:regulator of protease activity HflC (stomatin/prohibitin superfamily)
MAFLVVVGVLLLLASFVVPAALPGAGERKALELARGRRWLRAAGALLVAAALALASFQIVPAGQVGVASLFGRIDERPLTEGLNLVNPLKRVRLVSVRTHEVFEHAEVPSREGLTVGLDVSALYHLDPGATPGILRTLGEGYAPVFILPQFRSAIRGATVNHEAKDLYTSGREVVAQEIYEVLHRMLGERGIVLEKVLLRKIVLPRMVEEAINSKLAAEQEAERMRFVLLKERQEAERKRVEASGIADFQRIVTQGISEPLLKWKAIEVAHELSKSPNTKIVVLGDKSGLPIILADR